jgi:hypothetical protein
MEASSASSLTPISYQTNPVVMQPGQHRFLDYLRFGLRLQLVCRYRQLPQLPQRRGGLAARADPPSIAGLACFTGSSTLTRYYK